MDDVKVFKWHCRLQLWIQYYIFSTLSVFSFPKVINIDYFTSLFYSWEFISSRKIHLLLLISKCLVSILVKDLCQNTSLGLILSMFKERSVSEVPIPYVYSCLPHIPNGQKQLYISLFLLTLSIKMERSTVTLGITTFQFTTDHIYNCGIPYSLGIY